MGVWLSWFRSKKYILIELLANATAENTNKPTTKKNSLEFSLFKEFVQYNKCVFDTSKLEIVWFYLWRVFYVCDFILRSLQLCWFMETDQIDGLNLKNIYRLNRISNFVWWGELNRITNKQTKKTLTISNCRSSPRRILCLNQVLISYYVLRQHKTILNHYKRWIFCLWTLVFICIVRSAYIGSLNFLKWYWYMDWIHICFTEKGHSTFSSVQMSSNSMVSMIIEKVYTTNSEIHILYLFEFPNFVIIFFFRID